MDKGLGHAKANNGQVWIVNSSQSRGNFTQECQAFIESDIFPAFAENGIKYLLTIKSNSALTNLTIQSYEAKAGPHGLQLVEAGDVNGAIEWLKANAS